MKSKQIIPDNKFSKGFVIRSQKDHANGDAIRDLGVFPASSAAPKWLIAQWDSGPCLWNNKTEYSETVISDGVSKWVTIGDEGTISLHLNSEPYYSAKPDGAAIAGDYWPHLLLECPDFGYSSLSEADQAYYSCGVKKLTLSFDLNMKRYSLTENPKDWVEANQFLMYFYVRSKTGNDFVWFGVQLFDNRGEAGEDYCALDGGNASASGNLIFSIGRSTVLESADGSFWKDHVPHASDDPVHIELDLSRALEKMFRQGCSRNYFSSDVRSLDDLYLDGMNVGFETIGTFDTEICISNLSLISERTSEAD